jgi:hypothetical protein
MPITKVPQRHIADGAIADQQVAAGAGIQTNKLAEGPNFIKQDGTVGMTGNLSLGNNKLVNVATPATGTDATNKSYVDTVFNSVPRIFRTKPSAKAGTTGNINISNPGTATFDTVTLSIGDILFVGLQTSAAENGLYTFNGSGAALTRIPEMDSWAEVAGALTVVEQGSTLSDKMYLCTSDQGGTLGTTAINWQLVNGSGLLNSNFVDAEVPAGAMNGSNVTFTLANTPTSGTLRLQANGIGLTAGAGNDYTLSGNTITLAWAPASTENLYAWYRK